MVCMPLMNKVLPNPIYFGCLFLKSGDLKRGDLKKGGSYYLSHWSLKFIHSHFLFAQDWKIKYNFNKVASVLP